MSMRIYAKEEGGLAPHELLRTEDIVNGLTSVAADKVLAAAQGKVLLDTLEGKKLNKTNVANNLTTTAEGYALDARQGKALSDALVARQGWTSLWSGTWSSGNITVTGWSNWRVVAVVLSSTNICVVGMVTDTGSCSVMGQTTSSNGNQTLHTVVISSSGETLTLTRNFSVPHPSSNSHGAASACDVLAIYGLIQK